MKFSHAIAQRGMELLQLGFTRITRLFRIFTMARSGCLQQTSNSMDRPLRIGGYGSFMAYKLLGNCHARMSSLVSVMFHRQP